MGYRLFLFSRYIRKGSDNGLDLIAIDDAGYIWAIEVKSSTIDRFPNPENLDLHNRTMRWLRNAAEGKIAGKPVSQEAKDYAENILSLIEDETHQLKVMYSEVTLPKRGTLDSVSVTIEKVLGD